MLYAELDVKPLEEPFEWTVPLPDGEYRVEISIPVVFRADPDQIEGDNTSNPTTAGQVVASVIGHDELNMWRSVFLSRDQSWDLTPDRPVRLEYGPIWPTTVSGGLTIRIGFASAPPEKPWRWWVGIPQSLIDEQFFEARRQNWAKERARVYATALDRLGT